MATRYLSVSIKGFESVTCTFIFSIFRITFLASTSEGSYSVIAQWTSDVTVVFSCGTLVYVWKSSFNAELSNRISSISYIYWIRDSNAMLSRLVVHKWINQFFFKIRQLQGTLIQLMALITMVKWQIKSVANDYFKF